MCVYLYSFRERLGISGVSLLSRGNHLLEEEVEDKEGVIVFTTVPSGRGVTGAYRSSLSSDKVLLVVSGDGLRTTFTTKGF